MTRVEPLISLMELLIVSLLDSQENDAASYYRDSIKKLRKYKEGSELLNVLEPLISSYSITQYVSFTAEQERMLKECIVEAIRVQAFYR